MMKVAGLLIVCAVFLTADAFCHNPSGIRVTLKEAGADLMVSHSVSDPSTHYVKRIEVRINGEKRAEKDFTSQPDTMAQNASFDLPSLKDGDVLEIVAYCSKYGEVKKSVTIDKKIKEGS